MKLLKKIIFMIIICIIMILCVLVMLYINTLNNRVELVNQENEISRENIDNIQLYEVTDVKEIYNMENNIKVYFDDIYIAETELEGASFDENITDYNILEKVNVANNDKLFYIKNLYVLDINSKNKLYFIKGYFINKDINMLKKNDISRQEEILTIIFDKENNTFNITKYGEKYTEYIDFQDDIISSKIDIEKIGTINQNIEQTYMNNFSNIEVTDEDLAKRFYEDYKINTLYFPEYAYELIDNEYKKNRFSTFESYEKYLKKNYTKIYESTLSKYSIDDTEEYKEYTLIDTYQNNYIIKTIKESPMNYTVLLDNYTIKDDGYEKRYNNLKDENKVTNNITIFMSMINTGDYSHAYELLNKTFKQNNFNTEKKFESYISKNFFEYNIVSIDNVKKQGNYYISQIQLRNNNSSASEKKVLTIIMKLNEGTDFEMSFNIK